MAANGMSIGGLASGMDTNSIIDNLVALEQQKVVRVQKRQQNAETTLSTMGKLKSQFASFKDKAAGMATMDGFNLYRSNSADPDIVDIEANGKGIEGSFAIDVKQMAASLKVASKSFSDSTASLGLSGILRLSTSTSFQASNPGKPESAYVDIAVNASDAITDIASRINAATGAGATASVLNLASGDTRLVLTGVDTGANGFKVSDPDATDGSDLASALGFTDGTSQSEGDFSFRLASGGPAKSTSKMSELFAGVGRSIGVGDTLTYLDKAYTVTADNTLGDMLRQMAVDLKTSEGNISLDSSGRILVKGGVDVSTLAVKHTSAIDGKSQVLGSLESKQGYANLIQQGQDAFYTLNGLSMQNASNSDQDALEGGTIMLRKVSGSAGPIQVDVDRDDAAIKAKVQDFVDSYNGLLEMIKQSSSVTIEKTKGPDGKPMNSANYGPLASESSVDALKNQMQAIMTTSIEALGSKTKFTSLASIGITTDAKEGTMKLESAKFDKALATDFDGIRRLFAASGWSSDPRVTVGRWGNDTRTGTYAIDTTGNTISNVRPDGSIDAASTTGINRTDTLLVARSGNANGMMLNAPAAVGTAKVTFVRGVADQMQQLYAKLTNSMDGALTTATKSVQNRIGDISKQVDAQQSRVDAYKDRLVKQYSAMEKSMQKVKSQSSSFVSQIGR